MMKLHKNPVCLSGFRVSVVDLTSPAVFMKLIIVVETKEFVHLCITKNLCSMWKNGKKSIETHMHKRAIHIYREKETHAGN